MLVDLYFEDLLLLIFINFLAFYLINLILKKKRLLLDNTNLSAHKKIVDINFVPLSGGIVLIFNCFYLAFVFNFFNILYLISIYLIGLLADIQKINSVLTRFFFQSLVIIIFLINNDYMVSSIGIPFIDFLLNNNKYFAIIFSLFCLLILINGSNFIDGTNIQSSGYFFSIIFILLLLEGNFFEEIEIYILKQIIIFLLVFIFYNFFNKSYMGDGGIYLISFIIGLILINIQNKTFVSPFFIALLLWYPAFENFFSIIRKIFLDRIKPSKPDQNHLHHYLLFFLKKKFNLSEIQASSFTGLSINLFNLLIFFIASKFIYSGIFQASLIISCLIFYILIYFILKKYKFKSENV